MKKKFVPYSVTAASVLAFALLFFAAGQIPAGQEVHVISIDKYFALGGDQNIDLTIKPGDMVVFKALDKNAYIVFSNGKATKKACKSGVGFEYEAATDDFVSRVNLDEPVSICFADRGYYSFSIGGTGTYTTNATEVRGFITVR